MSSLKDKIYNYEITPPASAWDKIVLELNEADLSDKFPQQLYNTEVPPPPAAWDKIVTELDNPAGISEFSERLYKMEIQPPTSVWENVNSVLDQPLEDSYNKTPVRKITPFFRYAAAAVLIGLAAFGIIRFSFSGSSVSSSQAGAVITKDTAAPGTPKIGDAANEISPAKADSNTEEPTAALNTDLGAKADKSVKTITRKLVTRRNRISHPDNLDPELTQSIYAYEDHVPNVADRYVMLMAPDGNIVRMSKKWSELLCCVSGEEQDPECKDQLKKWQQKIATSSLAPSPGNFMDILSLVNSLN